MKFESFNNIESFYNQGLASEAFTKVKLEKSSGQIGYYNLPIDSLSILENIQKYKNNNHEIFDSVANIVVIGIGGSSLGSKAIHSLLKHSKQGLKNLVFLENSDPINITQNLSGITKDNSVFCLISKSGTTIETISIFKTILNNLELDLKVDNKRILIITDNGSSLSKFADASNIAQFNIPLNVGGRFSVLSAVGVVPLFLTGYDVKQLLIAANLQFDEFWSNENHILLKQACFFYANHEANPITALFSYSSLLEDFTKWFVQLWGESLGKIDKDGSNVGLTPMGLIGSVDQHSFLQLIIEGPKNKTVTFINVENFQNNLTIPNISLPFLEKTDFANGATFEKLINSQCDATFESLKNCGVNAQKLTLEKLDETTIASAIVYFELLTSLVGAMLNINTYDQPGVELGKNILFSKFNKGN